MKTIAFNTANHKGIHKHKCDRKFRHCQSKMCDAIDKESLRGIPSDVWNIAKNINIFHTEVYPQECADPMICSRDIKLSTDELNFLRKGPKFMLRQDGNENDFVVNLEKMVIKDKYEASSDGRDLDATDHNVTESSEDSSDDLKALAGEVEARSGMVYSKKDMTLNLGKLRATNYKFNKHVCLPRSETAYREAVHEVRKTEMLKIFRKSLCRGKTLNKQQRKEGQSSEVSKSPNNVRRDHSLFKLSNVKPFKEKKGYNTDIVN